MVGLKEVNETLELDIHQDHGLFKLIRNEHVISDLTTLSDTEIKSCCKEEQERMLAIQMLMGADCKCFGNAIEDLQNMYLINMNNQYLKTLHGCYIFLTGWKNPNMDLGIPNKFGVSFTSIGNEDYQ